MSDTQTTDVHIAFGRPAAVNDPTPAMIHAGVKALRSYLDNPHSPTGQVAIDIQIAIDIYRAMEDARAG